MEVLPSRDCLVSDLQCQLDVIVQHMCAFLVVNIPLTKRKLMQALTVTLSRHLSCFTVPLRFNETPI